MNLAPVTMSPVHKPTDNPHVYLTFDDGPDPEWTPRILDLLAAAQVPAVFFVIGCHAREQPALVRRLAANGHQVENHTWSHRHPWTISSHVARREVHDGAAAIADLIGQAPRFFRPPHGRMRRCMREQAESSGQAVVLWNRSAIDWGPLGNSEGIAARLSRTRAGDIVLMHDGGRGINRPDQLVIALPAYLDDLGRRGLPPVLLH